MMREISLKGNLRKAGHELHATYPCTHPRVDDNINNRTDERTDRRQSGQTQKCLEMWDRSLSSGDPNAMKLYQIRGAKS